MRNRRVVSRIASWFMTLAFVGALPCLAGTIGTTAATPTSVSVGVATTVTVTSVITDPSLTPGSVILQSLNTAGQVVAVVGTLHDDGLSGDAMANDGTYTLQTTVYQTAAGALRLRVSAGFKGSLLRVNSPPMMVNITGTSIGINILSPANLLYTSLTPINVTGTVGDPNATVTINGINAPVTSGQFMATVPLLEGLNTLTAVATNSGGTETTASVQVTLDTTPPHLTIDSPAANSTTTAASLTVTGTANDVVVGTVNNGDVQVTVNGIAAQVANRTYSATNIALAVGPNTIQAVGRDRAGNGTTATATITRTLPSQPPAPAIGAAVITNSLSIVSGDGQTGGIGTTLGAPLVVSLTNPSGTPVANQPVVFSVTGNDGTVSGGGPASAAVPVNTGANGQAQVSWTLGHRSGAGINILQASSPLAVGPVNFSATGTVGKAAQIVVDSGNNQTGALSQALVFPFVAVVVDSGHNRVPNVPVTFTVMQGGGNLAGGQSQNTTTDSNGRAIAVLTLGSQPGNDNNIVQASFSGNTGQPVSFTASAKAPGNPANTTISGVVLDNSNNPIPQATIRLFLTNQASNNNLPMQIGTPVQTSALGTFLIPQAPVGFFKLMADGSTAPGPKAYPTLEYDLVTVAGQDNTVGMPIYLPALDKVNQLCVDATHGGTLTLPQAPGFSLTVLPGSATFPGGSKTGCVSVTPVNGDKVPMAPGFGQQPRFIVTIQPVGTTFNPPAPITLPNADGLKPKAITEMYSYDHDLSMFVAIGTGTVSNDGSVIASNPGVGVLKAGWHCGGDPNVPGSGEAVNVHITTPAPVVLVASGTATVTAVAGLQQSLPGTYSWTISDSTVAAIQGSTANSSVAVKGASAGKATLTVRFTCSGVDATGVHPFAEASIELDVFTVKLTNVGWGGGNFAMMKTGTDTFTNDEFGSEGDTAIVNPIWIDANTDGTPETNDPAAYAVGSSPTLTGVTLTVSGPAGFSAPAKVKAGPAQNVSGVFNFPAVDVTLSGTTVSVPDLTTADTVGPVVNNSTYDLHWNISADGGATYTEFGLSSHLLFVTIGTPSGYYANPGVTAKRIDRATAIARGTSDLVTIAQKMAAANELFPGFDLDGGTDVMGTNHWALLDTGAGCDCISLSVLTTKHLRMIGITATEGKAYPTGGNPPGNTDASDSETNVIGGVPVVLGFLAAGDFNRFEGFFEINDAGVRKAFTVDPVQGPILEATTSVSGGSVSGDKLLYNVIKTTLQTIQAHVGGNAGKQFWFDASTGLLVSSSNSPIPFP